MIRYRLNRDLFDIYNNEIPSFLYDYINTKSMKRLLKIDMNCGMTYTNIPLFRINKFNSRLEHSIGVALITYHFTNDKKMTLSALFHDISTPVFSHVVDFLHNDYMNQEFTESLTSKFIGEDEEIMSLLKRDNISLTEVEDYHIYPIADNDSPKLSADRLEYSLSTMFYLLGIPKEQIKKYYDNLVILNNEDGIDELGFKDSDIGLQFAKDALRCGYIYCSDEDRYCMQRLSDLLKKGISLGVISEDDLWNTEDVIIDKLRSSELENEWVSFRKIGKIVRFDEPSDTQVMYRLGAKKRWINPLIENAGRLYDTNQSFHEEIDLYLSQDFNYYLGEKK